jgi:hypothetical protein
MFRRTNRSRNPWEFYNPAPMSLDTAMGQVTASLERNEHLLSMAADAANPARTNNSIDKARNALIDTPVQIGKNLWKVVVRPSPAMLSDAQIIVDLKKFHPVAEVLKKGRKTTVKEILGDQRGISAIILSPETRRQLRKMGIRSRSGYTTVGQVDAVYRKVWRKLLKESGENLDGIAAGHRIDLGTNRYKARLKCRCSNGPWRVWSKAIPMCANG